MPADTGSLRPRHSPVRDFFFAAGLAVGLIATILAIGCVRYGDVSSFLAAIRGDELFVHVQQLPEQAEGESRQFAFNVKIRNLTTRSFRVLGINDNCDCLSVEGIPATIGSRESKDILIKVRVSRDQTPTTAVSLITDDAHLNQINVALMPARPQG